MGPRRRFTAQVYCTPSFTTTTGRVAATFCLWILTELRRAVCCVLIMMRQLSPQPRSKDAAAARFVNYAFLTDASIKCSYLRAGKSSDRHQRDRRSRSKALAAQRHAYIARSTLTRFNVLRIRSAQSSPRKKREPESVVRCYDAMCWRQTDFA